MLRLLKVLGPIFIYFCSAGISKGQDGESVIMEEVLVESEKSERSEKSEIEWSYKQSTPPYSISAGSIENLIKKMNDERNAQEMNLEIIAKDKKNTWFSGTFYVPIAEKHDGICKQFESIYKPEFEATVNLKTGAVVSQSHYCTNRIGPVSSSTGKKDFAALETAENEVNLAPPSGKKAVERRLRDIEKKFENQAIKEATCPSGQRPVGASYSRNVDTMEMELSFNCDSSNLLPSVVCGHPQAYFVSSPSDTETTFGGMRKMSGSFNCAVKLPCYENDKKYTEKELREWGRLINAGSNFAVCVQCPANTIFDPKETTEQQKKSYYRSVIQSVYCRVIK